MTEYVLRLQPLEVPSGERSPGGDLIGYFRKADPQELKQMFGAEEIEYVDTNGQPYVTVTRKGGGQELYQLFPATGTVVDETGLRESETPGTFEYLIPLFRLPEGGVFIVGVKSVGG